MTDRLRTTCRVLLAAFGVTACNVLAALPVDDGPDGMTCYYFAKAALLPWGRAGGDWMDAADRMYGGDAYAVERVSVQVKTQRVTWNVTPLVARWAKDELSAGVMLLRGLLRTGGGTVNFASREHPAADTHPSLTVEWDDGTTVHAASVADTYFACPTHRGNGEAPIFQVSTAMNAALAFPFESRPGHSIRKASLTLTSEKQYSLPPEIGVFQAYLPGSRPAEVELGIASAYLGDRGIEKNPDVLFAYSFETESDFEMPKAQGEGLAEIIASDSANRFRPLDGRALKVTIKQGVNQGLNRHLSFRDRPGGEPEEAYFRYYIRFGESWNPSKDGGKLPGLAGIYDRGGWGARKSNGVNGWSARGSFIVQPKASSPYAKYRGVGSYVYHTRMRDQYGDAWGWGLGPTGLLEKNRWYSIEQRVKLNTPSRADGVLQAWIDGKQVFSREDIQYRSVPDLRIESVWLNVYHGGAAPAPQDMTLFMDNIVVARRYIGPARPPR